MKPKNPSLRSSFFVTLCTAFCLPVTVQALDVTWDSTVDGGAATGDPLWSNADNWVGDVAPIASGDSLVCDGTVGTTNTNDFITDLGADGLGTITFAATAGSFVLDDDGVIGPLKIPPQPPFPALRSGPMAGSGAYPQSKFLAANPSKPTT